MHGDIFEVDGHNKDFEELGNDFLHIEGKQQRNEAIQKAYEDSYTKTNAKRCRSEQNPKKLKV